MNYGEEETHVVELVSSSTETDSSSLSEDITPLFTEDDKLKINIFTISYVGNQLKPFILELWSIAFSRVKPSIGGLIGCLLILVSLCSTIYYGPEKEIES